MNVGLSTMDRWVRQLKNEREGISPKASPITSEQIEIRALKKEIKRINAGARSIMAIALNKGIAMSRYVVTRIMKQLGLTSSQVRRHRYKKDGTEKPLIPNRLARNFTVQHENTVWCGDITYIWTIQGWGLYGSGYRFI